MKQKRRIKLIGIAGSLREKSFNRRILREIKKNCPSDVKFEIIEIGNIPLFNQDIEESGTPESVIKLKKKIKNCDGMIFITPEYNHSVPGVLKNVIDWISRGENPLKGKLCAIGGVTTGNFGTARAQKHLIDILFSLKAFIYPETLMISNADEKFDKNLKLKDRKTQEKIKKFFNNFLDFLRKFSYHYEI